MRTVSQVVEEIIQHSPFYSEIIAEGLANNAEIARTIKPDVEKRLYEPVTNAAVSMALHRLSKKVRQTQYGSKLLKYITGITVRSNLVKFAFPNSADVSAALEKLSQAAKSHRDVFFNFSRGLDESMLIVSADIALLARGPLASKTKIAKVEKLSAITMRLPEESLNVPGIYHPILKGLAQDGISVVEIFSVRTEFSVILKDSDIDRAFSIIKHITS
ncbi:MAG: hypothetical protein UY63_C0017G0045 [Parcubacteria group bacterium GW2011_GWA2_51_10]|nr:MAG: hypothetical protein UY63_C0017G0045 [Parcubacteria group bacterium GW2011_GWA2_51_10]